MVLTDDGVLAECSIKTMVDDEHNDCSLGVFERSFESAKVLGHMILASNALHDACSEFHELPTGAAVELVLHPTSFSSTGTSNDDDDAMCFRMQANTPTSSCEMELHKDSTAIVQVQVEATIAASFQWTLLQAGLQVLPVASESFLRLNAQGFCSIQHMLVLGSHRAFVDVLLCPDAA